MKTIHVEIPEDTIGISVTVLRESNVNNEFLDVREGQSEFKVGDDNE